MVRKSLIAGGFACTFALAACTMLPALEEATGGIPVSDIVLRTKCELSDAFVDDEGRWLPDSDAKFAWLQNWTAQADLTLQILDQATLAPGVSAIEPLHNAYPNVGPSSISTSGAPGTAISAVSQSFAVAAGANLNGQAQRTETMSFTFSVAELRDWRTNANTARLCAISDNMDLRGRLGLREWFRQAVSPVVGTPELLYAGYHPKPGSAASAQKVTKPDESKTEKPKETQSFKEKTCLDELDDVDDLLNDANDTLTGAGEIARSDMVTFAAAKSDVESEFQAMKNATRTIEADKAQFNGVLDPAIRRREDHNAANLKVAKQLGDAANDNIKEATNDLDTFRPLPDKKFTLARNLIRDTRFLVVRRRRDLENIEKEERDLGNAGKNEPDIDDKKRDLEKKKENLCNLKTLNSNAENANKRAIAALADANAATQNIAAANANIKNMKSYVDTATEFTSKAIDPPIATIGQSVQFILTYGGNVTPTWTFVRFKGPNSPLLSTSGTRTHTLNITLGPLNPATNAPNADVKQNQFYLQLNSVFAPSLR
ncbi:hypothetical protein [Bradyrhizobium sp.]|jgi:hypothetical protein|uniref:hypothetical protein n=1 Tax=Bradyrhizobium sp. TaxID=376 RepID=UPI003C166C86